MLLQIMFSKNKNLATWIRFRQPLAEAAIDGF